MGPIHWAAKQGEMAEVQHLLHTDSTLMESRDSGGMTPLLWAVAGGHIEVAHHLLEAGADACACDEDMWDALHLCVVSGKEGIAGQLTRMLLSRGARVGQRDRWSATALHEACSAGYMDMMKAMLEWLAEQGVRKVVDQKDHTGTTALHRAVGASHTRIVTVLLSFGADFAIRNAGGCNARALAAQWGRHECKELVEDCERCYIVHRARSIANVQQKADTRRAWLKAHAQGQVRPGPVVEVLRTVADDRERHRDSDVGGHGGGGVGIGDRVIVVVGSGGSGDGDGGGGGGDGGNGEHGREGSVRVETMCNRSSTTTTTVTRRSRSKRRGRAPLQGKEEEDEGLVGRAVVRHLLYESKPELVVEVLATVFKEA